MQELQNFKQTITDQLTPSVDINPAKSLKDTPLCEISTKSELEQLIASLSKELYLGVDLEYSDHGYKALTCTIQVSSQDKDYIIDAIALKDHISLLSDILINPKIVKIFHACMNDLKWLQQDFNLFVINLFDTQKAVKALGYQDCGLAGLLKNYGVIKNKSMQREDFRIRPLPDKFKEYARTDAHFLVHLYHDLKNKLIVKNLLKDVLNECINECEKVYNDEDDSYLTLLQELKQKHNNELTLLYKLDNWRKGIAKELDKNAGYIISKNNLRNLVEEAPTNPGDIVRIAKSDYVRRNLQQVQNIFSSVGCSRGVGKQDSFGKNLQFQHNFRGRGGNFQHRGGAKRHNRNDSHSQGNKRRRF